MSNSRLPYTRDSYPLSQVGWDLVWLLHGHPLGDSEAEAVHKSEAFARLETLCIAEAGDFTAAVLEKLAPSPLETPARRYATCGPCQSAPG